MADNEYKYTLTIDPGETPSVFARVENPANVAYTQASMATIAYTLIRLSDNSVVVASTNLTISAVVFDTLQTWPPDREPDSTGYNFLHRPAGSDVDEDSESYEARYTFTDTVSPQANVSILRVKILTRSLPG